MAVLYDADGNEVTVSDSALTGNEEDTKAELAKVRSELERTQATVSRLASKPGMEETPELSMGQVLTEAHKAARERGLPADLAQVEAVAAVSAETMKRANKARKQESVAARVERLQAELNAITAEQ